MAKKPGTPKPASFDKPAPDSPVAAFEAFGARVTEQLEVIGNTVKKTDERIEAVEQNQAKAEESVSAKFAKLQEGDQWAEFADRLDKDKEMISRLSEGIARADEGIARIEALGGVVQPAAGPQLSTAFAQEIATGEGMKKYRELAETNRKANHRFKVDNMLPFSRAHGFAGESTVIIDAGLVGDGSDPVVQQGLTELIRDPIGLVDVINEVPGVPDTDTFKEMVEDEKSSQGFVVAAANGDQDGAGTPQAFVTVHNTEGFIVGQDVYVFTTAAGKVGPFTISAITPGTTITFASAVIVVLVEDGSLVTGTEFAATAESGVKPAGVLAASLKEVAIQTIATYVIMTRQRLRRTNLFDLMAWANRRLPVRLRENLEWHLLYGSGTAPQLHGFLNATQIAAFDVQTDTWSSDMESGSNRADLLLWSAANIPGDRQMVCVMHKLDWYKLTSAKDLNGNYVHGSGEGPAIINTPMLKAIGGLRVVLSSRIAQTYALVMDAVQASSFARIADAEMAVGWVNDQMIQNQQTMLYEQSFGHLLKVGTAWRRAYMNQPPV